MAEWIVLAILSAVFAALTSILAKISIKGIDSNLAIAVHTIVVVVFAWFVVAVVGSFDQNHSISGSSLLFLVLSGIATGASWLCCLKAIQAGDVNKVVPIDKSSIILTMALAFIFLGEGMSVIGALGLVSIFIGTMLMIEKKDIEPAGKGNHSWLVYAVLSAVFAALTSILGKVGIEGVESNLGTAIRTVVVLIMAWMMVDVRRPALEESVIYGGAVSF